MKVTTAIILLAYALGGTDKAAAEGIRLEKAGVRLGFPATNLERFFRQTEVHVLFDTPCRRDLGRDWSIRSGVDLSAGLLERKNERGFIGGIGPEFTLGRVGFPLEFLCGGAVTVLSRDQYGNTDFGLPLQFTSYGGLGFRLSRHWTTSYRYQHMSNGSLRPANGGLDLHAIGFSYRF